MNRNKVLAVTCATLILSGVLFWPTLYRYDKLTIGSRSILVRSNRVTGYSERFLGDRWEPAEEEKPIEALPSKEQDKVTGNAGFSNDGERFEGGLYNGSAWTIKRLVIRIKVKEKSGAVKWDRTFEASTDIKPLSTGSFSVSVLDAQGVTPADTDWTIWGIQGYRVE